MQQTQHEETQHEKTQTHLITLWYCVFKYCHSVQQGHVTSLYDRRFCWIATLYAWHDKILSIYTKLLFPKTFLLYWRSKSILDTPCHVTCPGRPAKITGFHRVTHDFKVNLKLSRPGVHITPFFAFLFITDVNYFTNIKYVTDTHVCEHCPYKPTNFAELPSRINVFDKIKSA